MELGIFAKTFVRSTVEATFDAVVQQGLTTVQFNMACAGLSSLPDFIDPATAQKIGEEAAARNIQIAAVSGTFNMIHPDRKERELGLQRLRILAAACGAMGTSVITLCTGTRNENNMWEKHPANEDSAAWNDLFETMEEALRIAAEHDAVLAFEPEPANVVDTADKGRKLLDEMQSSNLKVVLDAANLFQINNIGHMQEIMHEAFDVLENDIVIAHAKDIQISKGTLQVVAAGEGILDYDTYLKLLQDSGFNGALILHGLEETDVYESVGFLKQKLQSRRKIKY